MVKEKLIFWVLVVILFSTFCVSTEVLADGDIPLYFEALTPIPLDVVEEAAKFQLDLDLEVNLIIQEGLKEPIWEPQKDELSEVMLIPVYDLIGNRIAYVVLGYCGEGEMPTFDEILTDLRPFITDFEETGAGKQLFLSGKVESDTLGKIIQETLQEMTDQKEKWLEYYRTYDEKFENRFIHNKVFPYLELGFRATNKGIGDQLFGYWLSYDKLLMEYPVEIIEFKHYTYYDGIIFHEFKVGDREVLVAYNSLGVVNFVIEEKETLTYTPLLGYTRQDLLDGHEKFWNYFQNNDYKGLNDYRNRTIEYFEKHSNIDLNYNEGNGGFIGGLVPDYYYRYKSGCAIATSAALLAWEASQSHLYNTEFDDYSGDPIFTYTDYLWGNDEWWTVWRGKSDFDYYDWANNWLFQHDGYGGQLLGGMLCTGR